MGTFTLNSYQLSDTNKWVPHANVFETTSDFVEIREWEVGPDYRFDSQELADACARKELTAMGFIEQGKL